MEKIIAKIVSLILSVIPKRYSLAIFYRLPSGWFNFDTEIMYRDSRVSIWTGENIGRKLFFLNDFEGVQLNIFSSLVNKDTVFFDVGANIGVYSLVAGNRGAKCFAFEPSPEVISYLKKNISNNNYDITLVPEAVGAEKGDIEFYVSTKENMGVGRIMEYGKRTDHDRPPVKVPMNTLDYYSKEFAYPNLIKMDIEGAEFFALKGGRDMLAAENAPVLMIEFHPGEIKHLGGNPEDLMAELRAYGYRQYQHESAKKERWYIFTKDQNFQSPGFSEVT